METANLLLLLFVSLYLAMWNGLVVDWGLSTDPVKRKNLSILWHKLGFLLRFALTVYIAEAYGLFYGWLFVIVLWHLYDIIINLIRKMPPLTVDDKTRLLKMTKVTWIVKIVWIAAGIAFLF